MSETTTEDIRAGFIECGLGDGSYIDQDDVRALNAREFDEWLKSHDAEVERAAAEKAVAKVRAEIRQVPRWWNSEQGYGEFDLQPLGPNETSEKGAYMEVMRVLDECTEAYRRERKE